MPVSRLLVHPEQTGWATARRSELLPSDHLGLAPLGDLDERAVDGPVDPAAFATAIGPLGPVRAARWNRQLPANAAVAAGEPAPGSSPNASATSS